MASGTFAVLCHRHHWQFQNIFIVPKVNSVPVQQSLPSPWRPQSTFCLRGFACSGRFIEMDLDGMRLASFAEHSVCKAHPRCSVSQTSLLFRPGDTRVCACHSCVPVHQLMNGCFCFLAVVLQILFLWTLMYKFLFKHRFSVLLRMCLGMELLDCVVILCLTY